MNTLQLIQVMEHDKKSNNKFCGVYPSDLLPLKIERYPCGIILNTDSHTEKGSHWLAMYFPSKGRGEFFDSYGNRPEFYKNTIEQWLNKHSSNWTYNHRCLQSLNSSTCGQFCLYFIISRNHGKSFPAIVNSFSDNTTINDHRVNVFVHRYLNQLKPLSNKTKHQIALSLIHNRTKQ